MIGETTNWAAGLFGGVMWILYVVWIVLVIIGYWRTFVKAGKPGWGAIIPFYNLYLYIMVGGRPGWWLILYFIPFVNIIMDLIVSIDVSRNFGHGTGYGIGLWLLKPIFMLILGFGSDQYRPVNA